MKTYLYFSEVQGIEMAWVTTSNNKADLKTEFKSNDMKVSCIMELNKFDNFEAFLNLINKNSYLKINTLYQDEHTVILTVNDYRILLNRSVKNEVVTMTYTTIEL